jgi:hypothetical protein
MPSAEKGQRSSRSPAPARDFLKEISTAITSRPSAGVLYGPAGAGKSSTTAHALSPVVQPFAAENTWALLKQSGAVPKDLAVLPPAETWDDLLGALDQLIEGKHEYKTYVLDTLACAERLCHEHVCNRDYAGDWSDRGFMGFHRGYDGALVDWRTLIQRLDALRDRRGMGIILVGHATVKSMRDPRLAPFDRWTVDLHPKTWAITSRWCDYVFFETFHFDTTEDGNRTRGHGGDERVIYSNLDASYEAKNRFGITEPIPAGDSAKEAWSNIVRAISAAKNGGE